MPRTRKPKPVALPQPVPCPSAPDAEFIRVQIPKGATPTYAVCVGNSMIGFSTHWYDERQVPHVEPVDDCVGCQNGQRPRWYGYINVILLPSRRRRILAITKGAAQHSQSLKEHDGRLRGKTIRLTRMGDGPRAPVKAEVYVSREPVELPEDWDTIKALYQIWGVSPPAPKFKVTKPVHRKAKKDKGSAKNTNGEVEHGG